MGGRSAMSLARAFGPFAQVAVKAPAAVRVRRHTGGAPGPGQPRSTGVLGGHGPRKRCQAAPASEALRSTTWCSPPGLFPRQRREMDEVILELFRGHSDADLTYPQRATSGSHAFPSKFAFVRGSLTPSLQPAPVS